LGFWPHGLSCAHLLFFSAWPFRFFLRQNIANQASIARLATSEYDHQVAHRLKHLLKNHFYQHDINRKKKDEYCDTYCELKQKPDYNHIQLRDGSGYDS